MKRLSPTICFAALAGVLCLLLAAHAHAVIPVPPYRGWVTDNAGIIPADELSRIERLIQAVKDKSGAEIAVLTVPTTDGEDIFDFAMRVAEAWKPGIKGKDNGVVFVVASEDRKMWILVGYGLEGALPDGKVGAIRDEDVIPRFKSGDFGAGIEAGVRELARTIAPDMAETDATAPVGSSSRSGSYSSSRQLGLWDLIKIGIVLLFFLYMVIRHPRLLLLMMLFGGRGGGSRRGGGGFSGGFGGFGGGGFSGGGAGGSW
jgi:uncharacterized protein